MVGSSSSVHRVFTRRRYWLHLTLDNLLLLLLLLDGFKFHLLPAAKCQIIHQSVRSSASRPTVSSQMPSNIIIKHQQHNKRSWLPQMWVPGSHSLSETESEPTTNCISPLSPISCHTLHFIHMALCVCVPCLWNCLVLAFFLRAAIFLGQDRWPAQRRQENVFTQKQMQ